MSYYNDSKGTNIAATRASLAVFDKPILLILGGSDKGYDFDAFFENLPENLIYISVIGDTANQILNSAKKFGFKNIEKADTLFNAVKKCKLKSSYGDIVLLSPACASFGMFRDYADRGQKFKEIVNSLE